MPEPEKKVSSIIVRGADGRLVNMLPKTEAGAVSYGETNAASELERLDGQDVGSVETAMTSQSETVTETRHVRNVPVEESIDRVWTLNFTSGIRIPDEEAEGGYRYYVVSPRVVSSSFDAIVSTAASCYTNTVYFGEYVLSLEIPSTAEWTGIDFGIGYLSRTDDIYDFLAQNGTVKVYAEGTSLGECTISGSEYSAWEGLSHSSDYSNNPDASEAAFIQFTPPSELGGQAGLFLNGRVSYDSDAVVAMPVNTDERKHGIEITVIKTGDFQYRINIVFADIEDYDEEVETVVTRKFLDTTLTRKDGTESVATSPVTGLLQNITIGNEHPVWVQELSDAVKTYPIQVVIADSDDRIG